MESANHFELYGHFNNINIPDYEHGNSSAFFVSLISFTSDLWFSVERSFAYLNLFLSILFVVAIGYGIIFFF